MLSKYLIINKQFKNGLKKIEGKEQQVYNALKKTLDSGAKFIKQYDSNDLTQKNPLVLLQFPNIKTEYNPNGIVKDVQTQLNNVDDTLNLPKFDFDWERFYNEFKPGENKPTTSEPTQLVVLSTELAAAKAKYDKAQAKYLDLKKKLEKDPAFGMGGQTDIFGNVSGTDNMFGNEGQKQAVEAVQAAKKAAEDLKPAVDELQAKVDRLKEAVQDKVRGQQEVKFEERHHA